MSITEQFADIVEDLARIIKKGTDLPLLRIKGEKSPLDVPLVYAPPSSRERESSVNFEESLRSAVQSGEHKAEQKSERQVASGLPANYRCTLCSNRLYPIKKFRREGRSPIAVLHYTGPVTREPEKPDRSQQYILGGEEEDSLFRRMFEAAGGDMDDIHFQEYPACRFDHTSSIPEDWNERCQNCLTHVESLIQQHKIRLLILTGPSSYLMLSEDKAKQMALSGESLPIEIGNHQVNVIVIRSPMALLAYQKKRETLKKAGRTEEYTKLLAEEKSVKTRILESLKKAFREIHE